MFPLALSWSSLPFCMIILIMYSILVHQLALPCFCIISLFPPCMLYISVLNYLKMLDLYYHLKHINTLSNHSSCLCSGKDYWIVGWGILWIQI
jgi:hypothetical protein